MAPPTEGKFDNRQLLAGIKAWEDEVVAYLYNRTRDRLYFEKIKGRPSEQWEQIWDDASDCAAEALRAIAQKLKKDPYPQTWVLALFYKIAHNKWVDKKRINDRKKLISYRLDPDLEVAGEEEEQAFEKTFQKFARQLADRYLPRLSAKCYKLVRMRYLNHLAPREMAEILQQRPQGVRTALSKCLASLRQLIPPDWTDRLQND
jgi:RNA polymerase sigma factor (sigma-70 family)